MSGEIKNIKAYSANALSKWTFSVSHISTILGGNVATGLTHFSAAWTAKILNFDDIDNVKDSVEYAFWLKLSDSGEITASICDGFIDDVQFYQLIGYCKHHDIELEIV